MSSQSVVPVDLIIKTVLKNTLLTRTDLFGKGSSYVAFEKQDADLCEFSGLESSLRFGRIAYRRRDDDETKYSKDLILKVTPKVTRMRTFSMLQFFNEVFFYAKLLPLFQAFDADIGNTFPQYYNSLLQYNVHVDEAAIVFENLRSNGFTPCKKKSFLDYDHLRLMMRKLGHFHAHSYRARLEKPYEFHVLVRNQLESNGHRFTYFPSLIPPAMRGYEPLSLNPQYRFRIDHLCDSLANSNQVFQKSLRGDENNCTHVVCHGDFLANNILFAYEGGKPVDMKMVDLGTWRFASPVFDLAMVLYLHTDQKMRDEHWDNLLDEYFTTLYGTFPSAELPSKDSILAEFQTEATFTAYLIASWMLPFLIACDNDGVSGQEDLVPIHHKDVLFGLLPAHLLDVVLENLAGDIATVALEDILRDMVDRGFM